jgi:hypothetical protein
LAQKQVYQKDRALGRYPPADIFLPHSTPQIDNPQPRHLPMPDRSYADQAARFARPEVTYPISTEIPRTHCSK